MMKETVTITIGRSVGYRGRGGEKMVAMLRSGGLDAQKVAKHLWDRHSNGHGHGRPRVDRAAREILLAAGHEPRDLFRLAYCR